MVVGYYSFAGVNSSICFLVSLKNGSKTEQPESQRAFYSNMGQVHGLVVPAFCNDWRGYCSRLVDSTTIYLKISLLDPPLFFYIRFNSLLRALEIHTAG